MKTAKKVLSILIAITMMLSMVSVAATAAKLPDCKATISLTAQKATYTSTGEEKSGRTGKTYSITTDVEYDTTVSDPKNGNALEVEPGDTVCIRMYLTSDYNAGLFQTPIYYSSDLGDAKDIITTSLSREGGMTQGTTLANYPITDAVLKKITGFNDQHLFFFDDPEYGKIADINAKNTLFTVYSDFANAALESRYATILEAGGKYFTMVENSNYNEDVNGDHCKYFGQTEDGQTWATAYFSACPITDDGVYTCPMSEEMGNVTTWFLQMPLQIPADAKAGTEYKVMIPAEAAKKTYNPYGLLTLGYIPGEGEVKSADIQNMEYNYLPTYDLTGATVTLTVKGTTPPVELDWDNLEALYEGTSLTNEDGKYTTASWEAGFDALKNAVDAAGAALETKTLTDQDDIDALASAITDALAELELKADYSDFNDLVTKLDGIAADKKDGYDYTAVDEALEAAKLISTDLSVDDASILADFVTTYQDVDKVAIDYDITYAVAGALGSDVVTIIANDNPVTYTVEDEITFDAAKITLSDSNYNVDSIFPESIALGTTGAKIVTVNVTKDLSWAALEQALADAPKVNDGTYTNNSWGASGIQKALADAATELEDKALTDQNAIDALTTALNDAVAALKVKADYTAFNELVSKLEGIAAAPEDGYDYTAVNAALAAAEMISTDLSVDDASILADFVSTYGEVDKEAIEYTITYVLEGVKDGDACDIIDNYNPETYTVEDYIEFNSAVIMLNNDKYSIVSIDPERIEPGTTGNQIITVNVEKELTPVARPTQPDDTIYNGEVQRAIPENEAYGVVDGAQKDAGSYNLVVKLNDGYVWEDTNTNEDINFTWNIEKKALTVSGLGAFDREYDGTDVVEIYSTYATLDGVCASDDVFVSEYPETGIAESKNVGQSINVALEDQIELDGAQKDNYYVDMNSFLITVDIDHAQVNITINDSSKKYGMDDPEFQAYVDGLIGADTIEYTLDRQEGEDVGTYDIFAMYDGIQGNYRIDSTPGTFTIKRDNTAEEPIAATGLIYNGDLQTGMTFTGSDVELGGDRQAIDAGDYQFTATPDKNHTWADGSTDTKYYDWSIGKATYDMSGVKFEDKTVDYDGDVKTIEITGTLPDGVTVKYENNTGTAVGTYDATAIFTGDTTNYYPIDSMYATLTIERPAGETDIVDVQYEKTPIWNATNYQVKIMGRAIKFQFVDANNNTWTFDRNHADIVAYDLDGNVVDTDARTLAYEIWTVENVLLPAGNYDAVAKYPITEWQKDSSRFYKFTEEDLVLTNTDVISATLNAESGKKVPVTATIVVGADVQRVQLELNGSTVTSSSFTNNDDGTKTCTIRISTKLGTNTIYVNAKANNVWANHVATLTYTAA